MKYGTYRDSRANKKEPLSDSLVINYNRFFCSFFINGSFADALSCNMQIANKMGLKFQQNLLKVDTNIVLYQNLVDDTILQI